LKGKHNPNRKKETVGEKEKTSIVGVNNKQAKKLQEPTNTTQSEEKTKPRVEQNGRSEQYIDVHWKMVTP